jgi:hypothetical protein
MYILLFTNKVGFVGEAKRPQYKVKFSLEQAMKAQRGVEV